MTVIELGALGEFLGSIVVMFTLIYLAVQVRHNTAQQKREETVSIQRGHRGCVPCEADRAQHLPIDPWYRLALNSGASATVGGMGRVAERPVR